MIAPSGHSPKLAPTADPSSSSPYLGALRLAARAPDLATTPRARPATTGVPNEGSASSSSSSSGSSSLSRSPSLGGPRALARGEEESTAAGAARPPLRGCSGSGV